jgi:hypothetical protein
MRAGQRSLKSWVDDQFSTAESCNGFLIGENSPAAYGWSTTSRLREGRGDVAKRVYFCFHCQDVVDFRASVVRNHWLTKPGREAADFCDASLWESARKQGDVAIKRLINSAIDGTTATCVLIG